ncbi:cutinase [Mycolicibacterium smegmatis]|uniref:Cutinase Cut1 n=3 Tax=Mycolicibacterium smegmatis TaxID=1772 RepID=I7F4X0_MYCS2|nr:serine esterase, cutinase family protein [Mycolicibacterium smegmatis MC2 155]AIU12099.1 cutinase [Mycolicibacterium smegmatis]AFP36670.1 Cutinase Cut1 [Mycolicibacterium smegmatis MC2 155]AIU05474.1 cutinase [Mycolicibacterium smegmatis MC2 155]AIU18723.1 cutinase [Mycolicibacterium smegmatis]
MKWIRALGVCCASVAAPLSAMTAPQAFAAPESCADVEVIFARGTGEAPGVGPTGQAFIDALRPRLGDRSVDVYPVNYPATDQWATGVDGVRDASTRIISMAETCPQTEMVLGGYSQGAAVAGFVTSAAVPDGVDPATVPKPLQPDIADHVAAVVLFGLPNERAMNFLGEPRVVIGPLYETKTRTYCATEDPVCSDGLNFAVHNPSSYDGDLTDQGAAFAADRINTGPVTATN